MLLVRVAAERGAGLDELDRYIAMADRHDATERQKAHTAALVALMSEAPQLAKDKRNEDFGNAYISLGKLVSTTSPLLAKHGLAASWEPDQSKGADVTITCVLSHVAGHSTRASLTVPRDVDDRKNDLQAIKSSTTYARSITYEAVCGLAATEANVDDDGAGAGRDGPNMGEPSQLLKNARLAADQGDAALDQFFADCDQAQRRELMAEVLDLQKRAAAVKVKK